MTALVTPSIEAAGNINPSRFITLSTTENHRAVESNSGDTKVIGISQEGTKEWPHTGASAYAATDGDSFHYYPYGAEALLKIGSGGVSAGDFVKPDNDGQGVTASSGTALAIALEAASAAEFARVIVISPYLVA